MGLYFFFGGGAALLSEPYVTTVTDFRRLFRLKIILHFLIRYVILVCFIPFTREKTENEKMWLGEKKNGLLGIFDPSNTENVVG